MSKLFVLALLVGNAAIGMAQLSHSGSTVESKLGLMFAYSGAYISLVVYHRWRYGRPLADPVLIPSVCVLTGIGLAALVRISPFLAWRQIGWIYLGVAFFALMIHLPVGTMLRKYTYLWLLLGLGLLLWPSLYGLEVRGARSWALLGPFSFQPAEFAKIFFVSGLASYLSETTGTKYSWRFIGPVLFMVAIFCMVLTLQRDLGTALLLFSLAVSMVAVATSSWRYVISGIFLLCAAGGAAVAFFDHVRTRFVLWIDPWPYLDGSGFQIAESLFALGAGGLFGTGWGRGMADRIPIVESDFIYSLLVEEIGLLGAGGVLFLLAIVTLRIMNVALDEHRDDVERLMAIGGGLLFALQTLLIVGGVTRLLPLTGVTLPFISYGGSSLAASFILLGMAYNLYVTTPESVERIDVNASKGVVQWTKG